MTQSQSASLMKPDQGTDVVTPTPKRAVAERGGLRLWRRENVVKESALAALLKPIALALALILSSYALLSLGTSFYRSYHRNLEHSAATHPDRSVLDILFPDSRLPADPVDLVVKDIDGKLHKMVASKSETDNFVNDTILMLDEERARIKRTAREDLDRNFSIAFQDREKAISDYADWFFAWKRSYVVLKESLGSAITRFFEAGRYQTLSEAVETDLREYFLTHYKDQVLRPELRDQVISQGVEQAARHAHDSYRRVIANGDMRLQLFLAKHTRHLEEVPASAPVTKLKLDWDAQKWKAPTYLMQDRAFDGIVGLGTAAAGGTVGALALGPVLNRVLAQSFGQLSRRLVGSLGTRLAFAQQGAVAGTVVQPVGGQVIGAAIGAMVGIAADYLGNAANEAFNREEFIAANDRALDATIETWKAGLAANLDAAVDKWFDDARSSVVLTAR